MRVRGMAGMAGCIMVMGSMVMAAPDEKMMSEAISLRDQGEFEKATRSLQAWIDQNTSGVEQADRRAVEFEIERIRRIRQDYELTRQGLMTQLQDRLTTFTEAELDTYEREGKLDVQLIDGQKLYMNSSASNLLFREKQLRARLKDKKKDTAYQRLYEQMLTARKAAELTSLSMVLPQDFLVTYTLTVANAGEGSGDASVLRDPAVPGLDCTAATLACAAAGGAECPAAPTVAQLQSAAGVTVPVLPPGGSATFTMACTVTGP